MLVSGDSDDPQRIRQELIAQAAKIVENGVDHQDFLRMKRSALGRRIRDLDSFDSTCFRTCAYHLSDFDYFRFPRVYAQIEATEIQDFLKETVREDNCSLSVIYPLNQEDEA